MPVEELKIDGFADSHLLQSRAGMSETHVDDLATAIEDGVALPPAVVFRDAEGVLRLASGYHRREAYLKCGRTTMPCEVRPGNLLAAKRFSLSANKAHGLKTTNADRRKAVNMALDEPAWKGWSNAVVAKECGVSESLVRVIRQEREATGECRAELRVGIDGKTYPVKNDRWPKPSQVRLNGPAHDDHPQDRLNDAGDSSTSEPVEEDVPPFDDEQEAEVETAAHDPEPFQPPVVELGPAAASAKELDEARKKAKYAIADLMGALRNFVRVLGPSTIPLNVWEQTANAWIVKADEEYVRRSRELSRNAKGQKQQAVAP